MKIKSLTDNNSPTGRLAESIAEFEKIFDEYFDATDSPNQGRVKGCTSPDCCFLDFYYYFDPALVNRPAYRNGIWIQVNNKAIWLFVLVNEKDRKKVSITSAADLKCPAFPQKKSGYICLPPKFKKPFAFYESLIVSKMDYKVLFAKILARLSCVCSAS